MKSQKRVILFGSTNAGKLAEVRAIGDEFGISIVSPTELLALNSTLSPIPDVVEDADTYAGNSALKSDAFFAWGKIPALADDAGLEVDALDGRPGVYSARYAGPKAKSSENIAKLLFELKDKPNRRARFHSYLSLRLSPAKVLVSEGELYGTIATDSQGAGGFGYDSVFVVEGMGETLAALKERKFPIITHRIAALRKLFEKLEQTAF